MFEVNILGMMVLTQKFAIDMAERRQGDIINIASMAGKMATAKSTVYYCSRNLQSLASQRFAIRIETTWRSCYDSESRSNRDKFLR